MKYLIQKSLSNKKSFILIFVWVIFITSSLHVFGQSKMYKDCSTAYPVCLKETYHFESTSGLGLKDQIPTLRAKAESFEETNSKWLKWKIKSDGKLSFIINPHDVESDFDFVVFKRVSNDCSSLQEVRSMVAGENLGDDISTFSNCLGITGLTPISQKEFDNAGCGQNSDNFLKSLDAKTGEEYVLFVNNYDRGAGFSISFEGSAELEKYDDCLSNTDGFTISNIYPNPGKDFVHVEFQTSSTAPIQYSIISNKGELLNSGTAIMNSNSQVFTLQTDNLISGSYIIQIKQGDYSASKIFIKI